MQKQMKLLLLAYVAVAFVLSSNYVYGCFESEKQVLLHFNQSLSVIDQDDDYTSSWVGDDCCSWEGIVCNNDGHVIELNLNYVSLKGILPESIGNLSSLSELYLSDNQLNGSLPESLCQLSKLEVLDVSYNQLSGTIPKCIGGLSNLTFLELYLSDNQLNGSLPESLCQLSKLEVLDVHDNQLSGTIPKCNGGLSNLTFLGLDSNSWEGSMSEQHLINLTSLTHLTISSKSNLVFDVNSEWIPLFQLEHLYIDSVNVGPGFPSWLLTQTRISYFWMQNTSISDAIPVDWFESLLSRAKFVDLSNNDDINLPLPSFIPTPNNMTDLILSNNHLSSDFPAYICNFTSMWSLVLSNCNISGELPSCLRNLTNLRDLDVMNNNLSGNIPDFFGSLRNLRYLNFHNNGFQGKLPPSIQNLTDLSIFDVGYNNLRDILPPWTGEQLPYLHILVLRANHFYGSIPKQFCNYSSIQVLNLAGNHITGKLPPCFNNLIAMTGGESNFSLYFNQRIRDNAKGYEFEYTSTLKYLFSLDLSNNNISGEIPEELMHLRKLLNLNLAGNKLSGRIPERIGKMEQLEYLDLSRNKLSGPIPKGVSELKHLIRLNLSFNDLSGRIPTGNQLQVLENISSIYAGNNQLCGPPTPNLCPGDPERHEGHDYKKVDSNSGSNEDDEHVWFYAGIGPGVLVGFLGFCGSLHFIKSWRYTFFHYVEKVFDRVALFIALSRKKFNSKQVNYLTILTPQTHTHEY